jgi:hypothetical protein
MEAFFTVFSGGPMMSRRTIRPLFVAMALLAGAGAAEAQEKPVTVTGTVVDAACFMIHPPAATMASHKDCGEACIARGVPLAILNEADNQLYFGDAKQLKQFHLQRVKASGKSVRKTEPMELKMAAGDSNDMVVRVNGGYNMLTIESIAAAPRAK